MQLLGKAWYRKIDLGLNSKWSVASSVSQRSVRIAKNETRKYLRLNFMIIHHLFINKKIHLEYNNRGQRWNVNPRIFCDSHAHTTHHSLILQYLVYKITHNLYKLNMGFIKIRIVKRCICTTKKGYFFLQEIQGNHLVKKQWWAIVSKEYSNDFLS